MPAGVMNRQSVAPDDMVGITATPGNMSALTAWIGPITAFDSGGGAPGVSGGDWNSILTPGSLTALSSAWRISSGGWPGNMRQFTLAVARCGSAFGAWPPLICVATQFVCKIAFADGSLRRRAIAPSSPFDAAIMLAPVSPPSITPYFAKYARVTS